MFNAGVLASFIPSDPWTPSELSPAHWFDDTELAFTGSNFDQWGDNLSTTVLGYVNLRPSITTLNSLPVIGGPRACTGVPAGINALYNGVSAGYAFFVFRKPTLTASGVSEALFYFIGSEMTGATRLGVLVSSAGNNDKMTMYIRRINAETVAVLDPNYTLDTNWHMGLFEVDWANGLAYFTIDGGTRISQSLTSSGVTETDTVGSYGFNVNCYATSSSGEFETSNCNVAGMIFDNTQVLSTSNRNKLFGWAAHKWGLTGNLPSDHPYKVVIPRV